MLGRQLASIIFAARLMDEINTILQLFLQEMVATCIIDNY
jgi:hypothetical protein